jgi:hypothetical protein
VATIGYDPGLLAMLRLRTVAAIESLRAVASDEPAAWEATVTARVARQHLEELWLPLIDRVVASEAMRTWRSVHLRSALRTGLQGRELGEVLAGTVRDVISRPDLADMVGLSLSLVVHAGDTAAMYTLLTELGGVTTARLLMELGGPDLYRDPDAARSLAATVRATLAEATRTPGLPPAFASELVDGLIAGYDGFHLNPAETLSYLLDDVDLGSSFLVSLAHAVVDHERAAATVDPDPEHQPWPPAARPSRLSVTFDNDLDASGSSPLQRASDPIYGLLEALARDSESARVVLTDPATARYLLAERRFDLDGYTRLAAAAEAGAAGPDVLPDAPAPLLHDAAFVASAFVNHVGSRDDLLDDPPAPVAASAAAILGRHLFAVHKEVLVPERLADPGTMLRDLDAFGPDGKIDAAMFDSDALAAVTELAADTDEAMATLRAALNRYEHGYAASAAAATARLRDADPSTYLERVIRQIGRLEGYLVRHAGHRAEAAGRDRDRTTARWVDVGSTIVGAGVTALPVPVLDDGLEHAAAEIEERWATHESSAEREFAAYAETAARRLTYIWYRELYAAGVITPDVPDAAVADDGGLVSWDEFRRLADADRRLLQDRMEENVWRGRVDIDSSVLTDAIKSAQQDVYAELE